MKVSMMEVAMFCLCVTTTIVSVERSTLFPAQRFAAFQALPTTGATCVAPFALGGAREHFGLAPDLSVYAKAMAAGFALAAVGGDSDDLAARVGEIGRERRERGEIRARDRARAAAVHDDQLPSAWVGGGGGGWAK